MKLNLQDGLAKVLALQHANKPLGSVVDALDDVQLGLDAAISEPLGQRLLVLLVVGGAEARLAHDEALEQNLLGDNVHEVLDAVALLGLRVVLANLQTCQYCLDSSS